uniref:LAGLIDADG homing endonuclease n=1 Tax=Leucocryptos marina TaxID=299206 RepID=A0A679EJX0_LEUMA|nr:LAGLIDADG homing endonuclease [Leucocryptos marina]BBQ05422.1 LAGLIDADG homing endonuclease [Leucocryptos marina]
MNKTTYSFPFFLGLLEGDGSIQVNHWRKRILQFRILIKLKYTEDNYRMLTEIRDELNIFNVHIRNDYVLLIEDDKRKLKLLIKRIDLFGGFLLTKVRLRYCFFKYALKHDITFSEYAAIKSNSEWFGYHKIVPYDYNDILTKPFFDDWLCGIIEAEGCFSVRKSKNHSFSISQKDELDFINAVKLKFSLPNKIQTRSNSFYVIETYNRRAINDIILFCDTKLKGQKQVSLNYFKTFFYDINKCRV